MSTPEAGERTTRRRRRITRRRRRIRRRALKNLRTALGEAGDQLTVDWVLHDRDLDTLRDEMRNEAGWAGLARQTSEGKDSKPLTAQVPKRRSDDDTVKVAAPAYPLPALVVIAFWLAAFLGFGYLFLSAMANDAWLPFTVLAAIGTATAAVYLALAFAKRVLRRGLVRRRR